MKKLIDRPEKISEEVSLIYLQYSRLYISKSEKFQLQILTVLLQGSDGSDGQANLGEPQVKRLLYLPYTILDDGIPLIWRA